MGDTFNGLTDRYEEWFVKNRELFESELALLRETIPPFIEGLEIGVGTGIFAEALGLSHGVDPSEEMAIKAVERGVIVVPGKGEKLPFPKDSFDLIVMITVDCFLEDLGKTLEEAYRVLSTGGFIVIGFIDKATPLGKVYESKKAHNEFYSHANFHSGVEITEALEKAEFEIKRKGQTIFSLENELQESRPGLGQGLFGVVLGEKI